MGSIAFKKQSSGKWLGNGFGNSGATYEIIVDGEKLGELSSRRVGANSNVRVVFDDKRLGAEWRKYQAFSFHRRDRVRDVQQALREFCAEQCAA